MRRRSLTTTRMSTMTMGNLMMAEIVTPDYWVLLIIMKILTVTENKMMTMNMTMYAILMYEAGREIRGYCLNGT